MLTCLVLAAFFYVTNLLFIRLLAEDIFMTVKDYNRSVDEFSDSVYRFILANIKDEDRAADVVQESYEKLWMHVSDIEYGVVKSWLFTTAYHTMIDIIRKEKG